MTKRTKIKIRYMNGQAQVMVLVKHPMETGRREDDQTGELIPAHYIESMTFELNRKVVAKVDLGPAVAANPLTTITISGAKEGDQIDVHWKDNKGQNGGAWATVPNRAQ